MVYFGQFLYGYIYTVFEYFCGVVEGYIIAAFVLFGSRSRTHILTNVGDLEHALTIYYGLIWGLLAYPWYAPLIPAFLKHYESCQWWVETAKILTEAEGYEWETLPFLPTETDDFVT